jgi:hypothetical protein
MCSVSQVFSHSAKGNAGHSDGFKHDLVYIAPGPILARLNRPHEGVLGGVKMLGRVFVFGRIAAAHVAAAQAQAQMNPGIAHLEAFLASAGVRLHVLNLVEV